MPPLSPLHNLAEQGLIYTSLLCFLASMTLIHTTSASFSFTSVGCLGLLLLQPRVTAVIRRVLQTPLGRALLCFAGFLIIHGIVSYLMGYAAMGVAKRYSKLCWLLVLPCLMVVPRFRQIAIHGYLALLVLHSLLVILALHGMMELNHYAGDGLWRNHIFASIQLAIGMFIALHLALERTAWWQVYVSIAIVLGSQLFFINTGRVGMLLGLALLLLLCRQRLPRTWIYCATGILIGFVALLYVVSPTFHSSVQLTWQQLVQALRDNNYVSSTGTRVAFIKNILPMLTSHLWLGHGLGSFAEVFHQQYPADLATLRYVHPHNEFLFIAFEQGLVGVGLFYFCIWQIWHIAKSLSRVSGHIVRGLVVACCMAGITEPVIFGQATGYTFIFLWSIWIGEYVQQL